MVNQNPEPIKKEEPKKPKVGDLPPTRATMIPCLSGMRGVAALSVVYLHLNGFGHGQQFAGGWDTMYEFGSMSVIFFFVLSAFLLTYRGLYDIKRESDLLYVTLPIYNKRVPMLSMRWISYFIRRVFRIYPVFIIVVAMAIFVPRFQGDPVDSQAYYMDFNTGAAIPPSDFLPYTIFINVQSIFWSIPPEFEYYFVIPIIITSFEAATYADSVIFISKKEREDIEKGKDSLAELPFFERMVKTFFRNLLLSVFRILHLLFWSYFSLPGVLDTPAWFERTYNVNHLPPHFFRFWTGSFVGIMLYWMEQNHLVPKPPTKEELESKERNVKLVVYAKKFFFFLCDMSLWAILLAIIFNLPWYQTNYFGKVLPADTTWPPSYQTNTTYAFYHQEDFNTLWFDTIFTSTRMCAYMCGFVIFLICYGARDGTLSSFFMWDFFMYCGDVSFPLYLCHFIGLRESSRLWLEYLSPTTPILWDQLILGLWCGLVISTIMHEIVEKNCMKFGNKIIRYLRANVFVQKPSKEPEYAKVPTEPPKPAPTFSEYYQPGSLEELVEMRKQNSSAMSGMTSAERNSGVLSRSNSGAFSNSGGLYRSDSGALPRNNSSSALHQNNNGRNSGVLVRTNSNASFRGHPPVLERSGSSRLHIVTVDPEIHY
ncbi:hypothetical protein HK103_004765 [Boothiomyces macroporosus]|uniref:Acyltransferase 3 domain-containing protein n=1 Tax=Boothiomyces macroporosus TaxID=261099 RepID=A0AAD5UMD5_9FUNG|nr:hypothetical protein HK103_004765 [Boothiomyces macroporosus]